MKIIKAILISIPVFIGVMLIVVALQPDDFAVSRSASLEAPPAALFAQVNDHHKFVEWNPFDEMDPNNKNTFSGAESGVGAVCSWKGDMTGAGSSTIIESKPNELIRMRMDWKEPMEGTSTVEFTFVPDGDKTRVTWKMYGPQNFIGKVFSIFMSPEAMCGPMFEKGLANLDKASLAESQQPTTNQP